MSACRGKRPVPAGHGSGGVKHGSASELGKYPELHVADLDIREHEASIRVEQAIKTLT